MHNFDHEYGWQLWAQTDTQVQSLYPNNKKTIQYGWIYVCIQGDFFNCVSRFSEPKWEILLSQRGAFLHWKLLAKIALFFSFLYWELGERVKKHPVFVPLLKLSMTSKVGLLYFKLYQILELVYLYIYKSQLKVCGASCGGLCRVDQLVKIIDESLSPYAQHIEEFQKGFELLFKRSYLLRPQCIHTEEFW